MRDHALAMRYSKALFELVGEERLELQAEAGLQSFKRALEKDIGLSLMFQNPMLPSEKKGELLAQIAQSGAVPIPKLVVHFLSFLVARGRFLLLDTILETYHELLNASRHFEEVIVTTARPLRRELKERLEKLLQEKIGEKIVTETKVDPALLGGIQVQIRNRLFDGTVKSKLEDLSRQLMSV